MRRIRAYFFTCVVEVRVVGCGTRAHECRALIRGRPNFIDAFNARTTDVEHINAPKLNLYCFQRERQHTWSRTAYVHVSFNGRHTSTPVCPFQYARCKKHVRRNARVSVRSCKGPSLKVFSSVVFSTARRLCVFEGEVALLRYSTAFILRRHAGVRPYDRILFVVVDRKEKYVFRAGTRTTRCSKRFQSAKRIRTLCITLYKQRNINANYTCVQRE